MFGIDCQSFTGISVLWLISDVPHTDFTNDVQYHFSIFLTSVVSLW
jgi:hypothetical protein